MVSFNLSHLYSILSIILFFIKVGSLTLCNLSSRVAAAGADTVIVIYDEIQDTIRYNLLIVFLKNVFIFIIYF